MCLSLCLSLSLPLFLSLSLMISSAIYLCLCQSLFLSYQYPRLFSFFLIMKNMIEDHFEIVALVLIKLIRVAQLRTIILLSYPISLFSSSPPPPPAQSKHTHEHLPHPHPPTLLTPPCYFPLCVYSCLSSPSLFTYGDIFYPHIGTPSK